MTSIPSPLALEHATLATWRAREEETRFGWRFLAEGGITGRVNAVWPLGWGAETSLETAIAFAEAWYSARGLRPCFKLSDGATAPAALPQALAARGYAPHAETLVMTGSTTVPAPPMDAPISISAEPQGAFDDVLIATATSPADLAERRAIIARAPTPKAFATAIRNGDAVAVGMTALTADGFAGVFAMRTDPAARRQGLAQAILSHLAAFAAANGAATLFLQVEAANEPAVRLYQKAGFETAYAYRYWRKA